MAWQSGRVHDAPVVPIATKRQCSTHSLSGSATAGTLQRPLEATVRSSQASQQYCTAWHGHDGPHMLHARHLQDVLGLNTLADTSRHQSVCCCPPCKHTWLQQQHCHQGPVLPHSHHPRMLYNPCTHTQLYLVRTPCSSAACIPVTTPQLLPLLLLVWAAFPPRLNPSRHTYWAAALPVAPSEGLHSPSSWGRCRLWHNKPLSSCHTQDKQHQRCRCSAGSSTPRR